MVLCRKRLPDLRLDLGESEDYSGAAGLRLD